MNNNIKIVPLNLEKLCDVNKANEPFEVLGRLIIVFDGSAWSFSEELFHSPCTKYYPNDELDYAEYINHMQKAMFLAYIGDSCVGQIRISENWNRYCYIEDIAVSSDYRCQGIGRKLIQTAIQWAKEHDLCGLMLETQDINLTACRFYKQCGFILGAVDTMLYANCDNSDEKALFWYLKF